MMEKYDSCEHCNRPKRDGELLFAVEFWAVSQPDGRRTPSYFLVCKDCYDTRHQWCVDVLASVCERCGSKIPDGDHYFEREYNRNGQKIASYGLAPDETCHIICEACYHQMNCTA